MGNPAAGGCRVPACGQSPERPCAGSAPPLFNLGRAGAPQLAFKVLALCFRPLEWCCIKPFHSRNLDQPRLQRCGRALVPNVFKNARPSATSPRAALTQPVLPHCIFCMLFVRSVAEDTVEASRARRAFSAVMGVLSDFYLRKHEKVAAKGGGILSARGIAPYPRPRLWDTVVGSSTFGKIFSAESLSAATGRHPACRRLVNDAVAHFIDPPAAGRWRIETRFPSFRRSLIRDLTRRRRAGFRPAMHQQRKIVLCDR
jgi:hypothetical protein